MALFLTVFSVPMIVTPQDMNSSWLFYYRYLNYRFFNYRYNEREGASVYAWISGLGASVYA